MIARAPIVDAKWNIKQTQDCLDKACVGWQRDTFKIDNDLVHHILSQIFMDVEAYVKLKQRKGMQDVQAFFSMFVSD